MEALAVPDIAMVSESPETFSVQEEMWMSTAVLVVPMGTVTAHVCPLSAVATVPETVKLMSHMTPPPLSIVETCVGSTLMIVIVSPVKSTGAMVKPPLHIGSIEPEPNVQVPAKAAAGSPEVELLPQPNRKSAAAAPQTRAMDDFVMGMIFSVG
jgi:hypothetical protein